MRQEGLLEKIGSFKEADPDLARCEQDDLVVIAAGCEETDVPNDVPNNMVDLWKLTWYNYMERTGNNFRNNFSNNFWYMGDNYGKCGIAWNNLANFSSTTLVKMCPKK